MNKRGFTLIELLAVILILGIIALIAIPTVNNVIRESRVGAWKSTANTVITAYEQYAQLAEMKGDTLVRDIVGETNTDEYARTLLDIKGDLPETFIVLKLNNNGDALIKFNVDSITCSNVDNEDSESPITTNSAVATTANPDELTCW